MDKKMMGLDIAIIVIIVIIIVLAIGLALYRLTQSILAQKEAQEDADAIARDQARQQANAQKRASTQSPSPASTKLSESQVPATQVPVLTKEGFVPDSKPMMLPDSKPEVGLDMFKVMCSKSCCGQSANWPAPAGFYNEKSVDYVPNEYMCYTLKDGSGCPCLNKQEADYLIMRGGNV